MYFPAVTSSIYLPQGSARLDPQIRQILDDPVSWRIIEGSTEDKRADAIRVVAAMKKVNGEELASAVQQKLDTRAASRSGESEEAYRAQEYDALVAGCTDPQAELYCETVDGSRYGWASSFIERVGLVKKLRETRVLHGFSRLVPASDIGDPRLQPLSRTNSPAWLPAMVVHGEGIFLQLRSDSLQNWAQRTDVADRIRVLADQYDAARLRRGLSPRRIDGRFVLMHTLAHILIRELSFSAGYGSASLRERIFCNPEPDTPPMNGILVYTASGDSEGTLGGLVALGKAGTLENLVSEAVLRATWCSNDPVCIESNRPETQNLAACHACLLLAETSCEEGNRLLDRAAIVGRRGQPGLGFLEF